MSTARILIAEDEPSLRALLEVWLADDDLELVMAANGEEAWQVLQERPCDLVISDIRMPRMSGMDLVRRMREERIETPTIIVTAYGSIESAVEAMQEGAIDYLTKPFDSEKLKVAIERGLRMSRILAENRQLRSRMASTWSLSSIITRSEPMIDAINLARRVANSTANVLVWGESGTGKELITRGIHHEGTRASGPFVAINCAAIPDNLLEAELFGHEKGAFTGAFERKLGKFELANGGTLFLDEIADISGQMQAKVLRAIENRELQRVGGQETIRVDVRIIAATNKDLRAEADAGRFREDLYFRLNVFPIHLPALRERPDDIIPLAEHFLETFCEHMGKRMPRLTDAARRALGSAPWPGNVRELQNAIERAVILLQGDEMGPELLSKSLSMGVPTQAPSGSADPSDSGNGFAIPDTGFSLEEHEKSLIRQALERARGRKAPAARMLGLTRGTLNYRIKKFGIEDEPAETAATD